MTPFGVRKRDVLKEAWKRQMNVFEFAESDETRDLREYEEDLLTNFEHLARIVERGTVDVPEVEA